MIIPKLKDYTPIDYRKWIIGDDARKGVNIKRLNLLSSKELEILEEAIPFQDQRNDPGQGEIVAYFAIQLLKYIQGDREITVPAAILHDIGFYGCDPNAWKNLVKSGGNTESEANRRPHQNRGLILAGRILEKVGYPERYNNDIADIIGDHDTRKLPVTDNGKIVRASDLLWRVTYPMLQQYHPCASPKETLEKLENKSIYMPEPHNLGEIETQIGRVELVNTLFFKFSDEAQKLLRPKYEQELEKIVESYK